MDFQVRITDPALADFEGILEYSWIHFPATAARFGNALLNRADFLKKFPSIGSPVDCVSIPPPDAIGLNECKVESREMAREYIDQRDGNYYVAGTRISLDSIVHAFRRGESPETICQNFELLRLEDVYGAIAHYLANQADIDAYLIRQSEKWAEGKRSAEPLPANLRERLMRARDELHSTPLS